MMASDPLAMVNPTTYIGTLQVYQRGQTLTARDRAETRPHRPAMTEPEAGSDLGALKTVAVPVI